MKTSKLLLTSLLAAAAMSVPAYADIYISYGANNGNDTGGNGALTFDPASGWNKATNKTNSTGAASTILKDTSGADSGVTTTWSSKNSYRVWATTPPADAEEVLKGYLDDGPVDGHYAQVTLSGISYLVYDVVVLAATDTEDADFSPVTINGTAYTSSDGGIAVEGNTAWGASRNTTIVPGVNSMTLSGVTGASLSINGGASTNNAKTRGGIAGIQIINTYAGTAHAATLDADAAWTTTQLGSAPWTNSTAEAGKYADVTLSADVNLSASAGIVTDAIVVSGGHTLTLSAAEGNTAGIDLIGPGVVRVADGSTLSLANGTILNFKGSNSSITGAISGAGSLVAKSGSSLNLADATLTDFTGRLSVESGSTVNFGGGFAGLDWSSKNYTLDFASDATLKLGLTASIANSVKLGQADFAGRVNVFAGQFTINESDIGNGTWVLEDGVILRQFGTTVAGSTTYDATTKITTINNDMIVNSGTVEFRVNAGDGSSNGDKLVYAGDISGSGTLKRANNGVVDFTGSIDLGGFTNASSGRTNFTGSATLGTLAVSAGTVNILSDASIGSSGANNKSISVSANGNLNIGDATHNVSVSAVGLFMSDSDAGTTNTLTVASGSELNITGSSNLSDDGGSASSYQTVSVLVGHWNSTANLNLAGTLNSTSAVVYVGYTGGQTANVNVQSGGVLNALGVNGENWGGTANFTLSEGGAAHFGASGIKGMDSVSLGAGTIGSLSASGWTTSQDMTLSGADGAAAVFNTSVYDAATKTYGDASSITLNGLLSGTGGLTKRGAGMLTLTGTNTYTGGTVIEAGTLVAANASALGAGNVTVASGATLDARAGLQVGRAAIASTLTTEGSAKLVLGALNTSTAAIVAQGDVTLSAGTIFDVGSLVAGGKVVSSAGTLTVADSGTFTKANFLLNGSALGGRTEFTVSTDGNAVTISDLTQTALSLMWNNYSTVEGNTNVWTANGSGWYNRLPSDAQTFQNGDSVSFVDGGDPALYKEVLIDGSVTVSAMDVNGEFTFTGQNGAAIFSTGTLTKRGTDTAKIDSTVDLSGFTGGIEIGLNGGKLVVDTASGYTGAVTADRGGTFTLNVSSDTTLSNTLSGAGTFEKTGARTLTVSSANAGLTGQFVISEGTVKLGTTGNVFGADEREAVVVNAGGTLDVNGKAVFYKVELAGGKLVNNGSGIDTNTRQLSGMRLSEDSSVISNNNFGLISSQWTGNELDLAGHTLTKTGSNMFWLVSTDVTAGVIDVREGALVVMNGNSAEKTFSMAEGALIKINGGELKAGVIPNGTYKNVSLGDVAIVLTEANKGTAHITVDTNCSFNADGATLYLDIGALTAATLTPGEDVSLTIAAASAIANDSFFSTVEVGRYEDDVWQISSEWKYLAGSWSASAGTLSITAIPEPSVFGLLAGLGALALAGTRRRRRKA